MAALGGERTRAGSVRMRTSEVALGPSGRWRAACGKTRAFAASPPPGPGFRSGAGRCRPENLRRGGAGGGSVLELG